MIPHVDHKVADVIGAVGSTWGIRRGLTVTILTNVVDSYTVHVNPGTNNARERSARVDDFQPPAGSRCIAGNNVKPQPAEAKHYGITPVSGRPMLTPPEPCRTP
ncbi:hypothetical protein [Stenotrophomonas phage CM2]